jgi:hypothetical protein
MAQAVIDLLELVQVQHQQSLAPMLWLCQTRVALGIQRPPVRQPGQLVGGGGQPAKLRHPLKKAKRHLGTTGSCQQGHRSQGHSQGRHRHPATHDQHPQPRDGGHRRHRQGRRSGRRSRLLHLCSVVLGRTVDPHRHQGEPDPPSGVQRCTDHVTVAGPLKRVDHVSGGEDQQARDQQTPPATHQHTPHGGDSGDSGHEHQIEHRVGDCYCRG